jgi:thioredoxin reductase (NADPH)
MEGISTALIFIALIATIAVPYWWKLIKKRKHTKKIHKRSSEAGLLEPATLHPKIDLLNCIGCASCVRVCPEDVLGIVNGRAAIVNGVKCVGHSVCAEVCPVGAITMGFGKPKQGMEIPLYDEHFETSIKGLYITGELGGIGLIKNAIDQGVKAINHIVENASHSRNGIIDVAIIGAGPAGIGAALAAQAQGLRYVVLEQYDLGGSILHYPKQKLVLTKPVELPLYGKLKVSEISKEELIELFTSLVKDYKLNLQTEQKVETVTPNEKAFNIQTGKTTYSAANVVLALGRRGSPRKLGVPGEELPKVYYRLIDADKYNDKHILIVGGGDSAIEAAVGLARQKGNTITLSYRRDTFVRLKEKNEKNIQEMIKNGKIKTIFQSEVKEIRQDNILLLEKENIIHKLPNDFAFVFAGGELPSEFLKKIGVKLRMGDLEINAA